jgi:hypothetical protein
LSVTLVCVGLAVVVFLLPLLMPNGRWLIGCVGLYAATIGLLAPTTDDSWGGIIEGGILTCASLALGLGVAARFIFRAPPKFDIKLPRISVRSVVLAGCAAIGVAVAYSLFVMQSATAGAERVASGRPYCIEVATNKGGYETLRSQIDLAGFYMRGNGANHAVLVVRDAGKVELYHWSYRHNRFESGAHIGPLIYCQPDPDFLQHPRSVDTLNFVFHGYRFSIPRAYAPGASESSPIITIAARAPHFSPDHAYRLRATPTNDVTVTIGADAKLQSWRRRQSARYEVKGLGEDRGLIKERIESMSPKSPRLQYYELEPNGDVKTLVLCFEEAQYQCTHLFSDGRFSYYFFHMPADLRDWRGMQQALVSTMSSFVQAFEEPANALQHSDQ